MEVLIKKLNYWPEFWAFVNKPPQEPNEDFCLKYFLDLKAETFRESIEEFSQKVQKEYSLEKKLNSMIETLKTLSLSILPYKNTFVLANLDDVIQSLDE